MQTKVRAEREWFCPGLEHLLSVGGERGGCTLVCPLLILRPTPRWGVPFSLFSVCSSLSSLLISFPVFSSLLFFLLPPPLFLPLSNPEPSGGQEARQLSVRGRPSEGYEEEND